MTPRSESRHGGRPGFSLFELLLVIFIIGLMSVIAVPNLNKLVPDSRLNSESRKLSAFLRQARLKAANTQKAIRVSLNCMNHFAHSDRPSCQALMETAIYAGGEFDSWEPVRGGRLIFNSTLNIKASDPAWTPTAGSLLNDDMIWVVFTPSSRVLSSFGPPINITMWYGDVPHGGRTFDLTLNQASGRVAMVQSTH